MRYLLRILAVVSGLAACYAIWLDLTSSFSASAPLGKLWHSYDAESLLATEAIISRYMDPCSLIKFLDCSPFLWHPFVVTALGWPAALVFLGNSLILWTISNFFNASNSRYRAKARRLKRRGN